MAYAQWQKGNLFNCLAFGLAFHGTKTLGLLPDVDLRQAHIQDTGVIQTGARIPFDFGSRPGWGWGAKGATPKNLGYQGPRPTFAGSLGVLGLPSACTYRDLLVLETHWMVLARFFGLN